MRTTSTLMIIVLVSAILLGFLAAQTDLANPESTMAQVRRMDAATEQLKEESRLESEERQRNLEAERVATEADLLRQDADAEMQRKIAFANAQHEREMRELVIMFSIALVGAVVIILTVGAAYAIMQRSRQVNTFGAVSPTMMAPNRTQDPTAGTMQSGTSRETARQNGRPRNGTPQETRWKRQPQKSLIPEGGHM